MKKQLLFKIISGDLSKKDPVKEYKIYTDGTVEGFGEKVIVSNFYPSLLAQKLAQNSKLD